MKAILPTQSSFRAVRVGKIAAGSGASLAPRPAILPTLRRQYGAAGIGRKEFEIKHLPGG
jgi:hypothetical protein